MNVVTLTSLAILSYALSCPYSRWIRAVSTQSAALSLTVASQRIPPKVRQSQSAEIYRVSRCEWAKSRAFEIAFNIRFYFRCEATFSACFDKISEVKPHGPRLTVTASYFKWISPNSFARDAINSFGEFIIFPFLSPRACRCDLTPSSRCFVSVCCPFSYIVRGFADGNFHAAEIIFPRSGFRALERLSPGSSKYK